MNEKQIKHTIRSVMNKTGMDLDLVELTSGVNMVYDFIKNFVGVDLKRVQDACFEMALPVPLEIYIQVLTLHELGHAKDREALLASLPRTVEIFEMKKSHPLNEQYSRPELLEMRIEEHEMNIAFEETAWDNAEKMNQQYGIADREIFERIQTHSLLTYRKYYAKDLRLYDELTAAEAVQIA